MIHNNIPDDAKSDFVLREYAHDVGGLQDYSYLPKESAEIPCSSH